MNGYNGCKFGKCGGEAKRVTKCGSYLAEIELKLKAEKDSLSKKRSGFIACRKINIKCKQNETQSQLTTA